jgi:hypothetical protein
MQICHFPSPRESSSQSQLGAGLPEIRTAVQTSLDVQCFLPKDRGVPHRYPMADRAIRTLSLHSASLTSSILSRMILSYCKDKADPNNQILEKFSRDKLDSIVKALEERNFISKGPYPAFLLPVAVFGVCEQHLKAARTNPHEMESQLSIGRAGNINLRLAKEWTDNFPCERFDADRTVELARLLFPYLTLSEQAKIKVDADRISVFLRIQETNPTFRKYRVTFSKPFEQQSSEIKEELISENSIVEISELDLANTHIETISPEIFYHLKNLKKLHFGGNESSSLSRLENLEEIDLSHNAFTSLPPSFFENLNSLQKINLEHNNFSQEMIDQITDLCSVCGIDLRI